MAARRRRNLELLPGLLDPPEPPAAAGPAAPCRIRLGFTKLGAAAWMSHLDLVRTIQRILRRARLPIRYTAGFHPHPQVSFSPALGVGTGSRREFVDVMVAEPPNNPGSWLDSLNSASLPGLRFLSLAVLDPGEPAIESWAGRAAYRIGVPAANLEDYFREAFPGEPDPAAWLRARIAGLLAQPEIQIPRRRPGRPAGTKDIRPLLLDASAGEEPGEYVLALEARLGPQGTIRPEDWLELCLPGFQGDFSAERISMSGRPAESAPGS
jgi:radical SAM-linked protein